MLSLRLYRTDLLVRTFFQDNNHYNLLGLPREDASVGDVYMFESHSEQLSYPGRIENLLVPKFRIPKGKIRHSESLPPIRGLVSKEWSAKFGVTLLRTLFSSIAGSLGIVSNIEADYQANRVKKIEYRFLSPTRDSYKNDLSIDLRGYNVKRDIFLEGKNRFYVVTGVIRSSSFQITTYYDSGDVVQVNPSTVVAEGSVAFSGGTQKYREYKYRDKKKKLAFAVETKKIKYDKDKIIQYLKDPKKAHPYKGQPEQIIEIEKESVMLGED